jgi:hypothetical protein
MSHANQLREFFQIVEGHHGEEHEGEAGNETEPKGAFDKDDLAEGPGDHHGEDYSSEPQDAYDPDELAGVPDSEWPSDPLDTVGLDALGNIDNDDSIGMDDAPHDIPADDDDVLNGAEHGVDMDNVPDDSEEERGLKANSEFNMFLRSAATQAKTNQHDPEFEKAAEKFFEDHNMGDNGPSEANPYAFAIDWFERRRGNKDSAAHVGGQTQEEGHLPDNQNTKVHESKLLEFFQHVMSEGPLDKTFSAAPEIPAGGDEMGVEPGLEGAGDMTQDVAKMSASSLQFFTKNVNSAASKYQLEQEGFDISSLHQFAGALDALVFGMYEGVQEPTERQKFEEEYQKLAASWSTDLTKLFDKVLKLKSYSNPY